MLITRRWGHPFASDRGRGVALVVTAAVIVQIGAGVAKKLFVHVGPGGAVLLRCAFASLVMVAIARPRRAAIRRSAVLFGLALGIMNLSFYNAIDRLPLGLAVSIEFVGPMAVAIVGSRRAIDAAWVVLAGFGIAILTPLTGAHIDGLGIVFALGAGAMWAGYIVTGEWVGRELSGRDAVSVALPVATAVVVGFGIHDGGRALLEPGVLAAGFVVAMFSSAIPYTLEVEALRRIPKATFGLLMSLEPVIATLVGLVVLGERLNLREALAVVLILTANVGSLRSSGR